MTKEKRIDKGGRPSQHAEWLEPDKLKQLEAWARDGLTYEQIAHNCGISVRTLGNWKARYIPILQALKKGREVVDIEVENALLKRALGYTYEEVTKENVQVGKDGDGRPIFQMVETRRVTKEVLPDVTAQIFWLKNRKPAEWRDKQQIDYTDVSPSPKVHIVIKGVDDLEPDD